MKLTIESTLNMTEVDGCPVRQWRGTTEQGHHVDVYVALMRGARPAFAELDQAVAGGEVEEVNLERVARGSPALAVETELIEALEECLGHLARPRSAQHEARLARVHERARAAIARAKGGS